MYAEIATAAALQMEARTARGAAAHAANFVERARSTGDMPLSETLHVAYPTMRVFYDGGELQVHVPGAPRLPPLEGVYGTEKEGGVYVDAEGDALAGGDDAVLVGPGDSCANRKMYVFPLDLSLLVELPMRSLYISGGADFPNAAIPQPALEKGAGALFGRLAPTEATNPPREGVRLVLARVELTPAFVQRICEARAVTELVLEECFFSGHLRLERMPNLRVLVIRRFAAPRHAETTLAVDLDGMPQLRVLELLSGMRFIHRRPSAGKVPAAYAPDSDARRCAGGAGAGVDVELSVFSGGCVADMTLLRYLRFVGGKMLRLERFILDITTEALKQLDPAWLPDSVVRHLALNIAIPRPVGVLLTDDIAACDLERDDPDDDADNLALAARSYDVQFVARTRFWERLSNWRVESLVLTAAAAAVLEYAPADAAAIPAVAVELYAPFHARADFLNPTRDAQHAILPWEARRTHSPLADTSTPYRAASNPDMFYESLLSAAVFDPAARFLTRHFRMTTRAGKSLSVGRVPLFDQAAHFLIVYPRDWVFTNPRIPRLYPKTALTPGWFSKLPPSAARVRTFCSNYRDLCRSHERAMARNGVSCASVVDILLRRY